MCWLQSLDTNPYLHSGERCGVFGLARVATSKGGESINGWIAIPMVRCGICAVSTLRMCFTHAEYH